MNREECLVVKQGFFKADFISKQLGLLILAEFFPRKLILVFQGRFYSDDVVEIHACN